MCVLTLLFLGDSRSCDDFLLLLPASWVEGSAIPSAYSTVKANAARYTSTSAMLQDTECSSPPPARGPTPLEALAARVLESPSLPPLTSASKLYMPFCSLTVPLLDDILSTSPLLRLPREIIAASSERSDVEALWERATDGELTGNGWGRVEVRLLDEGGGGRSLGDGRFSHIFIHVAGRDLAVERVLKSLLPSLRDGGVLVVTCWEGSWERFLDEAAKMTGSRPAPGPLTAIQNNHSPEALGGSSLGQTLLETAEWATDVAVADWDVGDVLDWMREEQELATAGWSLAGRARFEQALRKAVVQMAAAGEMLHLKASIAVYSKQP